MINDHEETKSTPAYDSGATSERPTNDEVISVLNGLIETCRDGQEGFKQAADGVNRSDLKKLFFEFSQQRATFVGDLQSLVQTLGSDPENSGSIAGSLHRGWMDLKAAITGNGEGAVLNECERGEDSAVKEYKSALEQNLPAYILQTIQDQYTSIKSAHDRIKALRDSANNEQSSAARTS
jgi:uncharacterized protein (TIGR02284 family)